MKFKSVWSKILFLMSQLPTLLVIFGAVMERKDHYEEMFESDPILRELYRQLKHIYDEMKKA